MCVCVCVCVCVWCMRVMCVRVCVCVCLCPCVWRVVSVCVCVCYNSANYCGTPFFLFSLQIPLLMKKEEIFDLLCEHSVPMSRATWFIKVRSGQYTVLWCGRSQKCGRVGLGWCERGVSVRLCDTKLTLWPPCPSSSPPAASDDCSPQLHAE